MEPMNYALEGKGLLFPDDIPTFARSRNILKDWNLNPFPDVDKNMSGTSQEITVNTEFLDIVKKCTASNQLSGGLGAETVDASTSINGSSVLSLEEFLLATEKARFHSPVCQVHCHRKEDSIVYREIKSNSSLMENSDSLPLGKRSRTTNLFSQVPLCQVYGCNKDLSSSKGYHKRHRVCAEHSKTAKVIVNGVEQRFCQQCSRFHLLAEFDECKRSCRKRLAGHNERRRKPQFDTHWGSRLVEMTSESRVPFLFPVICHGSSFCQEKYENHSKRIKLERSPTKSLQHHHVMRKENSSKIHPRATQSVQVQSLSAGQNSACALSLLSAHSQHHLLSTESHCAYLKRDHNLENFCGISVSRRSASNQLYPSENFGKDRIVQVLDDGQAFQVKFKEKDTSEDQFQVKFKDNDTSEDQILRPWI